MNLFLLAAVPLAAVAAHRFFYRDRPPFADPRAWILGAVWSAAALVAASLFGRAREFTGDLAWAFAGLTLTDVLLVPGAVILAWILTRPRRDPWELGLWLALAFTFAGLRDSVSANRVYDLTELFLVPLDRILLVLAVPGLVAAALAQTKVLPRVLWAAAAAALVLTGALVPVLSFAHLGWAAWAGLGLGTAAAVWTQKKAAPRGDGLPV